MALSGSSTFDDALAQYNDNLSWEGNIAKAKLALESIRFMEMNRTKSFTSGETRVDFESLASQRKSLERYVNAAGNSNRSSFTRGRAKVI